MRNGGIQRDQAVHEDSRTRSRLMILPIRALWTCESPRESRVSPSSKDSEEKQILRISLRKAHCGRKHVHSSLSSWNVEVTDDAGPILDINHCSRFRVMQYQCADTRFVHAPTPILAMRNCRSRFPRIIPTVRKTPPTAIPNTCTSAGTLDK